MLNINEIVEALNKTTDTVNKALDVIGSTTEALHVAMEYQMVAVACDSNEYMINDIPFYNDEPEEKLDNDPLEAKTIREFEQIEKAADKIFEQINKTPLDPGKPVQIFPIDLTIDQNINVQAIMKRVREKMEAKAEKEMKKEQFIDEQFNFEGEGFAE